MDSSVLFEDDLNKMIEYLAVHPESINIFDGGKTPLMQAIVHERTDVIDILLAFGANVNLQDRDGWTALHYCCYFQENNRDMVQKLLNAKANALLADFIGNTPLHFAAIDTNDVNIIHDLTLCSNPNLPSGAGYIPLLTACYTNKNPEVILALINITNDINITSRYGETALYLACLNNNHNAIPLLLAAGADINITNNSNLTAYERADLEGKRIIHEHSFSNLKTN